MSRIFFVVLLLLAHFFELSAKDVHVCLTMLVKNDTNVITQCLKSVEKTIDCACICNIGSTDDTLLKLEKHFQEANIPFIVFDHPWIDFGHNRTLSAESAQDVLKLLGFPLENCYLMILDPDMQFKGAHEFQKENLTKDAYLIWEEAFSLSYGRYQTNFLRANLEWQSVGVANEYWICSQPIQTAFLNEIKIEEIEEPISFTKIKLERKAEATEAALKHDPKNPHYLSYLGHIYLGLGQCNQALHYFEAYLNLEIVKEESWFSKYMLGHCYEKLNEWDKALFWYLEAYQTDPNRAEPLYKIAAYYRIKGWNDLSYLFARHGSYIPLYQDPLLSPVPPLFDYQFDEEISISAYYTRFWQEGCKAVNQLILRKNVPWHVKNQAYRNLLFYIRPLPDTRFLPIEIDFPLIRPDDDERYHPMNPSIQITQTGYRVICRTVNYTQMGAKFFDTIDPSGIFRTRNFLVEYDYHFNLISQVEIIENLPRKRIASFNIEGLDDCRIFEFYNRSWFTCTTNDTNPTGNFQISLCRLADRLSGEKILVDKLIPLRGPDLYRCEKNWLPLIKNDRLHVIYSYDPFIIYQIDPETGDCETIHQYYPSLDFTSFRGSAAPIHMDRGYLVLVHEIVHLPDHSRVYIHRFLFFDESFSMTHLSNPFFFKNQGVEFCCGMVIEPSRNQLIMTLGIEDREAFFCFIPLDTVRSLLHPPFNSHQSP